MKRPPPNSDAEAASSGSKKRRRMSISDDDDGLKLSPSAGFSESPPFHRIYNSSVRKEKPDELFRKDLISAMKLPDNEQLDDSEFWDVTDSWKQEWERGVQVPVNIKNVPNPEVRILNDKARSSPFKLPKKLIRTTEDSFFTSEHHVLSDTGKKAESICKYDMDDLDSQWLMLFNEKREEYGLLPISEEILELVLEDFETQCSNRFQDALKTEKGLGIEYDEDVICDVCRSPECEEGNEMVFCDSCNICVHQACYGITAIPEGSWICRPCALNIKPPCILCPNMGGAMKSTSSGEKWAHVSCALWIPEVSIGCPEKMEPIMRISHIPASRWALICALCRERVGACIQCSVKQCKVAYHVTCAFEHGLEMEMKTTPIDSNEEGVKMQSYCVKHSKTDAAERGLSPPKSSRKCKKRKEIKSSKEPECKDEVDEHNARLQKIRSLEAQFHRFVSTKDTSELLSVDIDVVDFLYYYWVLKRRAKFNKPLLIAKCDEANLLIKQHENLLYSRLKMFVHLRQDLERVRNLCYMVSRREKIFRSYVRMKSQVFEKQVEILTDSSLQLTDTEVKEVLKARLGDTLFDRFYCAVPDEEEKADTDDDKNLILNQKSPNPYAKNYVNNINTRSRRRTASQGTLENSNIACDNMNGEMPILTKCKSEENLSADEKQSSQKITFTHSPFVIKVAPKQEEDNDIKPVINPSPEVPSVISSVKDNAPEVKNPIVVENSFTEETKCLETINVPENSHDNIQKIMNNNETSSDKNSLCLSDKENINALAPVKIKRTRSQVESRHTEFKNVIQEISTQKPDLFDDDSVLSISSEISAENKKIPKRSTRYQMRSRNYSTDVIEIDDSSVKSVDSVDVQLSHQDQSLCSPSDSIEELAFLSHDQSIIDEKSLDSSSSLTPQKRRGRPRKIIHCDTSDASFTVIKSESIADVDKSNCVIDVDKTNSCLIDIDKTNSCLIDIDKTNSCLIDIDKTDPHVIDIGKMNTCNEILEMSDSNESTGFRMSLRHNREYLNHKVSSRRSKRKRSAVKLEDTDSVLLKVSNKGAFDGNVENGSSGNSPDWNSNDKSPRINSADKPASNRIIIRLRKDPNRELWKNDSSSSSDGNVAFRIVHNDLDVNGQDAVSHFPSIIKDEDSVQSETYSVRNDNENKHRYLMRDRPAPMRTAKCNLGRS